MEKQRLLGKLPFVVAHRDLLLKNYRDSPTLIEAAQVPGALDGGVFPTPDGTDPAPDTDPLGNNKAGNCVYAAPGHMVKLVGQLVGAPTIITADMALAAYAEDTGYDPVTGANDNGANVRDMLNRWRQRGLYGSTIVAYCAVNWNDADEVAIATWLCGGVIGGYNLPQSIWAQDPDWYVPEPLTPDDEQIIGGHCIFWHGTSPGLDNGTSWGEDTSATPPWRRRYCEELWAPMLGLWIMKNGRAPNGFSYADLLADVQARASS